MSQNKPVPEPDGQWLVGNLLQFKRNPLVCMQNWQQQYGDIVSFKLGRQQAYLLSHPLLVEQALIEQADVFVKMYDTKRPKGLALVLGQGLLTSQGHVWQKQRRLMQPVFQRKNIAGMFDQMKLAGQQLVNQWQTMPDSVELNIADEMMRLALEVLTRTMFSTSVMEQVGQIAPALDLCLRYASKTAMNPLIPPLWMPTSTNRQFKKSMSVLDAIIYDMIENRRNDMDGYDDLLSLLLTATDPETGDKMNTRQLRDEVITIFTAGHETTANLMTWTLYYLAANPKVMLKLKQELDTVLQGKTATFDQLEQLVYTRAVLSESMRTSPPAGILMRKVMRDTRLQGYALKGDSLAFFNIFNIHHHPQLWQQPDQFNPERFLNSKIPKHHFFPFGMGSRFCIGSHFAQLETTLLLSMLGQNFKFTLISNKPPEIEMAVTLKPKGGLRLKVEPV